MTGIIRVAGTIIALMIVFTITGNPSHVKELLHIEANWQLFTIQVFGLAATRVFWSWPLIDRVMEAILRMFRGEHLAPEIIPEVRIKPTVRSLDHYPNNPHLVTRDQVGLGSIDESRRISNRAVTMLSQYWDEQFD